MSQNANSRCSKEQSKIRWLYTCRSLSIHLNRIISGFIHCIIFLIEKFIARIFWNSQNLRFFLRTQNEIYIFVNFEVDLVIYCLQCWGKLIHRPGGVNEKNTHKQKSTWQWRSWREKRRYRGFNLFSCV